MSMQGHTDAVPLAPRRAERRRSRQTTARSDQKRCDVLPHDNAEIGRDASAFYNHGGTIAVASVWLVLYAIAAVYGYIAWSLSLVPWKKLCSWAGPMS